ncbi:Cytidylate kinase [Rhodobacteraceae bacterium THAF1]|uniref:(d)CMP kinase n=1 Tax=Palleronia sp. THAF1 TaxID=2587842 RepID=UPI000F3F996B|nr:d(CMP) kinase [Palleronia sp. THAF1]QFU09461.1 Cytidylate kinase [Palleronia sp. THAF1]VDC21865.1 Cytidylate kinase [Rhodobacteraceae bacterium THAF1]
MAFTVAIDGPAASGKGTISRAVAQRFGFRHLDTGLLYRATGRRVLNGEDAVAAATALMPDDLQTDGLRSADVAEAASKVAAIPEVRAALVAFQRRFARLGDGAVLDGRDIGTVICPEAEVKLFVTASAEVRAARRHAEFDDDTTLEEVLADVKRRDERDAGRADAPMRAAEDAIRIDTTEMSIAEAVAAAEGAVAAVWSGG